MNDNQGQVNTTMHLLLTLVLCILTFPAQSDAVTNYALNKPAYSSSVYGGLVASRGNDGSTSTMARTGTQLNKRAWWCVKLDTIIKFSYIKVFNEISSVSRRMRNFGIRVSDFEGCSAAGFWAARICHTDSSGGRDLDYVHQCNSGGDFSGRYLFVNSDSNNYLNIREIQVYGAVKYTTNLALRQPAVLSSTQNGLVASKGNDGSRSTIAHSNLNNPGWWCVQLPKVYRILKIAIYNRDDKYRVRLRGFKIRVSEFKSCSAANFNSARICHTSNAGSRNFYTVNGCNNQGGEFAGRYIYISTAGNNYLHFKEFQVYGKAKYTNNLALKQPASMSSVRGGNGASNGNDGTLRTMIHTNSNSPAWWCVQLPSIYNLQLIKIYNRNDQNAKRMSGFQIRLSDFKTCSANNFRSARVCHKDATGAQAEYTVDGCNRGGEFSGRYVYVNIADTGYLHFRQFQVFGEEEKYPSNLALLQPATQSSVQTHLVASGGNDGSLTSIAHTNIENPGWWCVKLPSIFQFTNIKIYNRNDQHRTRLSGFQIRLSSLASCSAANFNSARVCHKDSTGGHNEYTVSGCNQGGEFSGRYVYINTGSNNFLHFREVQVFGKDLNLLPNLARNQYAVQSSTNGDAAGLAIDGNVNTCSRTNADTKAWLCVDLETWYMLDTIQIIQPNSGAISGYEVKFDRVNYCSTAGFNAATLCYRDTTGATAFSQCNQGSSQFDARSIYISVPNEPLSVCEVKVHPLLDSTCTVSG